MIPNGAGFPSKVYQALQIHAVGQFFPFDGISQLT